MKAVPNDAVAVGRVFSCCAPTAKFRIWSCLPLLSWPTLVVPRRTPGTSVVSIVPIAGVAFPRKCEPVIWDSRTTLSWHILVAVFVHREPTGLALVLADGTVSAGHVPPAPPTSGSLGVFLKYFEIWFQKNCWPWF